MKMTMRRLVKRRYLQVLLLIVVAVFSRPACAQPQGSSQTDSNLANVKQWKDPVKPCG